MTAPFFSDLYDYDRGLAKQFWNRANAGSARLIGKSLGLLGRGADLVGWGSARDALQQQRTGFLEEADQYDTAAGRPRNLAEKITGFAGAVTPDLMAYAAGGQIAGAGKAATFLGNVGRGFVGGLPVTAALEADQQDGSTAQTIGRLLGSPKIEALSRTAAGRVAVGATLDLAGNVIGEGIATGVRKLGSLRGSRTANATDLTPPAPRVPELETAQAVAHPEAERPLWEVGQIRRAEVETGIGDASQPVRYAAEHEGPGHSVVVHRSTQEPGKIQVTRLDANGNPYGHTTFDSPAEAGEEVARMGGKRLNGKTPSAPTPSTPIPENPHATEQRAEWAAARNDPAYVGTRQYFQDQIDAVTKEEDEVRKAFRPDLLREKYGDAWGGSTEAQESLAKMRELGSQREALYKQQTAADSYRRVRGVRLDPSYRAGFVNPAVAAHLASAGVGGAVGAQVGDTPEERQRNAALGAGVGLGVAATGTAIARGLAKAKPASIAAMADPAVQQVRSMISGESKGGAVSTVRKILTDLHAQQINKLSPLNEFSRSVLGSDELRHAAQNASGWIEAAGSRLRTEYAPIVKASEGIEDAVESLLAADRALELDRNGLSNKGFDLAAAQQASTLLSADPRVKQAADLYRDYYRSLLQRRADAGLITPDDYNRLVAKGAYYVPFVRDAEHGGSNASRGSRGLMQKGSGLRKMTEEEATSKIESPLRSAMKDTYQLEREISRQRVNDLIVKGWVTNPQAADDFVRQIPKGAKAPAGKVAEAVRYQGHDLTFAVDQDFHRAWTSLAPDAQDIALGWMSKVKNIQRFGVTMAPLFTARNFTRDLVFTAIQQPFTRSHAAAGAIGAAVGAASDEENPVEGAVMGFSSGVVGLHALKIARAFGEVVGKSSLYEDYLKAGGGGFGFWPRTQKDLDKVYAHLRDGVGAGDVVNPKSWLEGLEFVNHAIESAPRLAEARRALAAGGTMEQAAAAGRNISVDFSLAGGSLSATITDRTTPFFNAQKQGLAKTLTVLKNPKAWAMGGVLITAPSVALWNINKDDPEYWKQPLWVRNTAWLVPKGDGTFTKIVKPHEFGYLFGSLPERMLDWAYQHGKLGERTEKAPYSLGNALSQLAGAVGAGPMPGVVKPILENVANYDFFRDRPVVSDALASLPNEMQYDDRTSSIARGLNAVTGVSPVKADHLLRGYFGTAGQGINDAVTDAARGLGVDDRGPVAMDRDRGFLGGLTTDPLATPQPALDVLEQDRNIAKLQRVSEHLLASGQYDKIGPWFQAHAEEMGRGALTQAAAEQIRTLAQVELQIERARGMPVEQKREQIKQLRDAQYVLAQMTVQ